MFKLTSKQKKQVWRKEQEVSVDKEKKERERHEISTKDERNHLSY